MKLQQFWRLTGMFGVKIIWQGALMLSSEWLCMCFLWRILLLGFWCVGCFFLLWVWCVFSFLSQKISAWFKSELSGPDQTSFRSTGLRGHFWSSSPTSIIDITSKISPPKQSSSFHTPSAGERSSRQLFHWQLLVTVFLSYPNFSYL